MALIVRPKLAKLDNIPPIKNNKTNAYCKIRFDKNLIASKVHFNCGKSPDWSDELTFNSYNPEGIIWVEVLHQQPPHDILLGVGHIVLKSLELCANERKVCELILMGGGMYPAKTGSITLSFQYVPSDIQTQNPNFQDRIVQYEVFVPKSYDSLKFTRTIQNEQKYYEQEKNKIQQSAVGNGIQMTESKVTYEPILEKPKSKSKPKINVPQKKRISPMRPDQQKVQNPNVLGLNSSIHSLTPPMNTQKQGNNLPNGQIQNPQQNNFGRNSTLHQQQKNQANFNKQNPQLGTPQVQQMPFINQQQQPAQQQIPLNMPQAPQKVPMQPGYQASSPNYQQPQIPVLAGQQTVQQAAQIQQAQQAQQVQQLQQAQQTAQMQLQAQQQAYLLQQQAYQASQLQYPQQMYVQDPYFESPYGFEPMMIPTNVEWQQVIPQMQVKHQTKVGSVNKSFDGCVPKVNMQSYKLELNQAMEVLLKQQKNALLQKRMAEQLKRQLGQR